MRKRVMLTMNTYSIIGLGSDREVSHRIEVLAENDARDVVRESGERANNGSTGRNTKNTGQHF